MELISPCTCRNSAIQNKGLTLDCKNQGLEGGIISRVLNHFLPVEEKLRKIILNNNRLNKVPDEIRQFNHLRYVDLRFNQIRNIESGAINKVMYRVDLDHNQIYHIESGAFKGLCKSQINIIK